MARCAPALAVDVCEAPAPGTAVGPIQISLMDGELGLARRACPRNEFITGAVANLILEPENFYGNLRSAFPLGLSWAASAQLELFGSIEAFRYQTVVSSIAADALSLGHTQFGLSRVLLSNPSTSLSLSSRIVLPTAVGLYDRAWPVGLDMTLGGAWLPHPRLRLHGHLGGLASAALSTGASHPRAGAKLTAGAAWRALSHLSLVCESTTLAGYWAVLDHTSVQAAARYGAAHLGLELAAMLPLAGRERSLGAVSLRVSYRR